MTAQELQDAMKDSRFLDVFLCERSVFDVFQPRPLCNDFMVRARVEGVPEDAYLVKAWHDPGQSGFYFRFVHTSFEPVYPGQRPLMRHAERVLYERCPTCCEVERC